MISKKNYLMNACQHGQGKQKFALRKLSIGVASVLLGTLFLVGEGNAYADSGTVASGEASQVAPTENKAANSNPTTVQDNSAPSNGPTTNNISNDNQTAPVTNNVTSRGRAAPPAPTQTINVNIAKVDPILVGANIMPLNDSQIATIIANIKAVNSGLTDSQIHVEADGSTTITVDGQVTSLTPFQTVGYEPTDMLPTVVPTVPGYHVLLEVEQDSTPHGHEIIRIVSNYVPGYRPDPNLDTSIVVNVYYEPDPQKINIKYVDDDEDGKQVGELVPVNGLTNHKVSLTYTIPDHYEYVSGKQDSYTFKAADNQDVIVHLKHRRSEVSDQQVRTETIHYVYSDGSKAQADYVETVTLTRTGSKDEVTGEITWGPWSTAIFPAVTSPVIDGYTPDQAQIESLPADGNSTDIEKTVTYTKNQVAVPKGTNSNQSSTATSTKSTSQTNGKLSQNKNSSATAQLPQTGAQNDRSLIALGTLALLTSFGLAGLKRKN